jgi:hypothetical protein
MDKFERRMERDELRLNSAPIAQLVEQIPLKDKVPGSSPGGGTMLLFLFGCVRV